MPTEQLQESTSVKISTYTTEAVFDELQNEWNTLLGRSAVDTIFSTIEWQRSWWHAYTPGQLWVLTARDDNDRLIGIAPWFIETRESGERVVRGIGCVDVTDYVDTIVDASCLEGVYHAFARCLQENRANYDRINLCNLPEHSPTLQVFIDILNQYGFNAQREKQEVCPIIKLPPTWDEYLAQLDKKDRHELRRKMRRAHGAGNVGSYTVNETHNLEEQLETFLDMMAESAEYKAEFLKDEKNARFFRLVMPVMFKAGWLRLHFLTVDGQPAATYLNFDYNKRALVYNSGLRYKFSELSPGIVLLATNIREAIDAGYEVFDFLRGNEEYKYDMGGRDTTIYMLKAN